MKHTTNSRTDPVKPGTKRPIASLVQKLVLLVLCADQVRRFVRDDTNYFMGGEYVTVGYYVVGSLYATVMQSNHTRNNRNTGWEVLLVTSAAVWFAASLEVAYTLFTVVFLIQSVLLGLDARRYLSSQEAMNRKKVDDNEIPRELLLGPKEDVPTDDIALNVLREREAQLRKERQSQREVCAQEAILLAGQWDETETLSVV